MSFLGAIILPSILRLLPLQKETNKQQSHILKKNLPLEIPIRHHMHQITLRHQN